MDPARSFRAWLQREQGKKKDKKSPFPAEISTLLSQVKRDAAGESKLRDYYLQYVCLTTKPAFEPLTRKLSGLTQERDALDKSMPGTLIFKEMAAPRESHVMMRGQYDKPGEKVEPNTPAVLPPLIKADPKGRATRLDLARWLVSRRASVDEPGGRQSLLAAILRHRPGQTELRLRRAGRTAEPSGTARLPGHLVPRKRLGHQGPGAARC